MLTGQQGLDSDKIFTNVWPYPPLEPGNYLAVFKAEQNLVRKPLVN